MQLFSIEFWTAILVIIDMLLVIVVLYLVRSVKSGLQQSVVGEATDHVIALIEPLLKEAGVASGHFEQQLKEKNRIINVLNEKLDSRIISLNLLLNRANMHLHTEQSNDGPSHVYDQQTAIAELVAQGYDAEAISEKLSMPTGEVELVIDLKKKLMAMA